ncbi:MAG: siroheme synthase CysG [Candidatus Dormibacteria bacterium]
MGYYGVFLDLTGRLGVVLGDGHEAAAKVRGLLDAGARVLMVAPNPGDAVAAMAASPLTELRQSPFAPGDLDGAAIVIDASLDPDLGVLVSRLCRERRIAVNVLDRPELCDWIAPAVVRRDPVQVAITTSGRSPFMASFLRERIERWLGAEWGELTESIGLLRDDLRQRSVPLREQLPAYRRALASESIEQLRAGRRDDAHASVRRSELPRRGRVVLVGAGPGDPALLTVRAVDLLGRADTIVHDALVDRRALDWARPDATLIDAGKRGGADSPRQEDINDILVERASRGELVVRLKGGDPFVFGRGGEEYLALARRGIDVEVVPGVSSATAAAALAGIPLTHRGVSASFAVTTAVRGAGLRQSLAGFAAVDTLVVLMGRSEVERVASELVSAGRDPDTPAAVVVAASCPEEQVLRGRLATIAGIVRRAGTDGPATLVVGEVVDVLADDRGVARAI